MTTRYLPSSISKLHNTIYPIYARGSNIYTESNRKYLDLTSGIGALNTGHNHPIVVNRVKKQLDAQKVLCPNSELDQTLQSMHRKSGV